MPRTGTDRAVLVFTRSSQREARVKGLGDAARVFERLRERTVQAAASMPDADLVVVGEPGSLRLPPGTPVLPQRGRSFAQRLNAAFQDVRALGFIQVVVIGTDAPELGARQLREAFGALESHDVVLGPAADGGVYLIGAGVDLCPRVAGVAWTTNRVHSQLLERNPDAAVLAERLDDIDRSADLVALVESGSDDLELLRQVLELLAAAARPLAPPAVSEDAPGVRSPILERGPPRRSRSVSKSAA